MDFEALYQANFSQLDETVADWTAMLTKLSELKTTARDGLKAKADAADWAGYNAGVSRQFVAKTAGEFDDAHTQATSIRNIMRDTRDELKTQKRLLSEAVKRGRTNHLTVRSNGSGFTVTADPDAPPSSGQQTVEALRDELQGILDTATEIDDSASTALRTLVDLTTYGFSGAEYADRDAAYDAIREAEELADLAAQEPEDLSPEEFDRLSAGLSRYSGDELFAERFATRLGAEGTLAFWAGINERSVLLTSPLGDRVDQYDELQRSLGLTLATASHADTPAMAAWRTDAVALGPRMVPAEGGPTGFQIMSNLMRWGDYDDQFLRSYGSALMTEERRLTDNGREEAYPWGNAHLDPLNRTGTDDGIDPLIGYMRALSNSPDAATDFFNTPYVSADGDHEFERDTDNDGDDEKAGLSNFQYLFEERQWPPDWDSEGEESISGRNNMAMALEAATTGHPAGQMPTAAAPAHTDSQAALVESIFSSVSDDPSRLSDHGYMSDSMGQIASEYLPDINRATADDVHGSIDKLFPAAGSVADLNHVDVTRFLVTVGQNPEGNAAIEVGQAAYMANLMDYHLNPNLPEDQRYLDNTQSVVEEIARRSAEVGGTLAVGRQEAIVGPAAEDAKDFADSISQQKNAWSGAIGTGIGVGVSFVATPVGGAVAGGAAGTVSSMVLEHIFQQSETNAAQEAAGDAAGLWEASKDQNVSISQSAAEEAARRHRHPDADQVAAWARLGAQNGFSDASTSARQMADDLNTEVQPG